MTSPRLERPEDTRNKLRAVGGGEQTTRMTTLRSPFAEALPIALRHAQDNHLWALEPNWLLGERWRKNLEAAQDMSALRIAGEMPDWRGENHASPTLSWILLSFIGDEPPDDLLAELDSRVRGLESNDPDADRRHLPSEASVKSFLQTLATTRYLIEQLKPSRRIS